MTGSNYLENDQVSRKHQVWAHNSSFLAPVGPSQQLPKTLPSLNTFVASLSMLPTPKRDSNSSMLLSHDECASTLKVLVEPTQRQLSFVTPDTFHTTPQTTINPLHLRKPDSCNGHGRQHRSIGQDLSKFNLHCAALLLLIVRETMFQNIYECRQPKTTETYSWSIPVPKVNYQGYKLSASRSVNDQRGKCWSVYA
jgi:hypothetical protein